jgi:GNAT superfamily N-acetyltransferase
VTRDDYAILPAAPDHVGALPEVERRAASRFGSSIPPHVLAHVTPQSALVAAQQAGRLWVALAPDGEAVGFALAESSAERAHLEEIDVVPEHGRQGIGAALVSVVERWAAAHGCTQLTLTTYSDVPWNADFYESIGFESVPDSELDDCMLRRLKEEAERGLERSKRVAMRKLLRAV